MKKKSSLKTIETRVIASQEADKWRQGKEFDNCEVMLTANVQFDHFADTRTDRVGGLTQVLSLIRQSHFTHDQRTVLKCVNVRVADHRLIRVLLF
jgi:hypothetical protein